jgi:hypothetical protein
MRSLSEKRRKLFLSWLRQWYQFCFSLWERFLEMFLKDLADLVRIMAGDGLCLTRRQKETIILTTNNFCGGKPLTRMREIPIIAATSKK